MQYTADKMNKSFSYQRRKIFYRVFGSGIPVLLIHGFGEDGEVWKQQVEYLKDKAQLIVPDLPGSGQSEMIDDMSMEGMAEVMHAIIHEEELDTVTAIGHSMGGYILLALVEKYWNHIDAFGLFHSTAFADSEEKKATRRKGIDFIREHGAFEFLKTATPNLFSPMTRDEQPKIIDEQVAIGNNFSADALVSYYEAMIKRPDRTNMLQKTTLPVLFIMGKYDMAVPMQDGLKQCYMPKISYIHILQQSGHMGMLEESGLSNRFLDEFLLQSRQLNGRITL